MKLTKPVLRGWVVLTCVVLVSLLATPFEMFGQSCIAPPSGLVSWFPGDGNAQDLITGNPATVVGGVTYATGKVGQAFVFDGITGSVNVPNTGGLYDLGSFTIDFWMKADADNPLNCCQGLVTTWQYGIEVDTNQGPSSNVDFFIFVTPWASGKLLQPDVWYHVAGTYDESSAIYYVNGELISQGGGSGPNPPMAPNQFLSIGSELGRVYTDPRWFKGMIDEVEVYNRALSQSEIQSIFQAGAAGKCKFAAQVQPPMNADGSSVYSASRGVVPVKFTLTWGGVETCNLPPATISLARTAGGTLGPVDENVYEMSADSGSTFRLSGCQYMYNLASKSLGVGTYLVQIYINGYAVGSATFGLR